MLKPIRALVLSTALLAQPALSQPGPAQPTLAQPAGLSETLLHIAETAEVTRAPDEVVATLRAEARAGTAAAAQEAVNRGIAAAVERARAVEGVQVSTGGYWTARVDDARAWQASQSLTLRGQAAPALLELAGTLQGQGLAMVSLDWRLTRQTARLAREEASGLALDALRRRAATVAGQLGLELVGLREVRIDVPEAGPRPMMMAARAGAAAPVAVAEDAVVSATVAAVAVLRPR
ncbi:SIMPL domain-containing protein [Falsiroseomonas sp.]|uniref:SIMPL domain-containing protein n=1 Tax=Falsiroseomonas sp. TaxID=2870721 RepID=UPI00272678CE|nr:SIMPL domain-containing protein [Falsiroseomonas sp.]MDO9502263.1 SIMPL domain-containing protein [Falsiroseomonas sp.]